MIARQTGELALYALINATITPVIAFMLAEFILAEVSESFVVPMAALMLTVLSCLISMIMKKIMASRMTVNFNAITVNIAVFVLEFIICWIFAYLGMPLVYAASVLLGAAIAIAITTLRRPSTLREERKRSRKNRKK